ncbi:MAG: FRG domain-containing protein [Candidatus Omnitrophota bacterium]|jgi:hypothetical protein
MSNFVKPEGVDSYEDFQRKLNVIANSSDFIWRGQKRDLDWPLNATLSRYRQDALAKIKKNGTWNWTDEKRIESFMNDYSENLKKIAGKKCPDQGEEEIFWAWAQHIGAPTHLLDWTECPYTALFFAWAGEEDSSTGKNAPPCSRVVYGLNKKIIDKRNEELCKEKGSKYKNKYTFFKVINILRDGNPRCEAQKGVFSQGPLVVASRNCSGAKYRYSFLEEESRSKSAIIEWVEEYCSSEVEPVIYKFVFSPLSYGTYPEVTKKALSKITGIACQNMQKDDLSKREDILKKLYSRGVGYLTLFPDEYGIAEHAKLQLTVKDYGNN